MTIERKVGMGIAGQPSGGPTDVADVFSTHLYAGNAGSQTITNGIDLAGEGGMVWFKRRNGAVNHVIFDTERWTASSGNGLFPNLANGAGNINELTGFNSNGFGVTASGYINDSYDMASWTFRKKKKFFDIITYSGNSVAGRQISHALGGPVGMIISKCTSEAGQYWHVFHRSAGHVSNAALHAGTVGLNLNTNGDRQIGSSDFWGGTLPTSTHFSVGAGNDSNNITGKTYVAYVFADNSSEDAEDQMIKCGSYTGTGASVGASVTLGWEPQFVLVKAATAAGSWAMMDTMRGIPNNADNPTLFADTDAAEVSQANWLEINSTGFKTLNGNYANGNASGVTYIYMAIRAPMMVEPEAATDVWTVDRGSQSANNPHFRSGFPVDMALMGDFHNADVAKYISARLTGTSTLATNVTTAETNSSTKEWDYVEGWYTGATDTDFYSWMWKRAKGFFDLVSYTGISGSSQVIPHSLGVTPEMIWTKSRSTSGRWLVLHKDLTYALNLGEGDDETGSIQINTPTSTSFTAADSSIANGAGVTYTGFLFATLAGISKVGSYTGNGGTKTIDCGFSAGARFILIKRYDADGSWYAWDSVRGIEAGNEPWLAVNTNDAQTTNTDLVDPHNSGFKVYQSSPQNINVSNGTYIFYAIA